MDKENKKLHKDKWLKDIPLQTTNENFKPEEIITCQKCQRKNPPTRLDCMYCGVDLELDENQNRLLKPVLRKIESFEKGFNLIYLANTKNWSEQQISETARMTRLSKNDLEKIAETNKPLPLARAENKKELEVVSRRLSEIGIETEIFSDEDFQAENLPRRLRRIEFFEDKLIFILFNSDEIIEITSEELNLIVIGAIFEKRFESTEKHKKKQDGKVLDYSEASSDEILVDIYTKNDKIGCRISQKGFDFSSLGDQKKLLAKENIKILISKLKDFAPEAEIDQDYLRLRESLNQVWNIEERKDSKGLERKGFGKFNRLRVTTTNNLAQFTKYARLQWLLRKNLES